MQTTRTTEAAAILDKYGLNSSKEFRYMMLSRLQGECIGFITDGDWRYHKPSRIWAQNVAEQIEIMRALWHSLPIAPEWLTLAEIDELEKELKSIHN